MLAARGQIRNRANDISFKWFLIYVYIYIFLICSSGYDVGPNSVEIMDGSDEGIFIWYSVNLLHG